MSVLEATRRQEPTTDLQCSHCGAIVPAQASYCRSCGVRLIKEEAVQVPTWSLREIIPWVLPLFALGLWFISTGSVDVSRMNDLGLISVLPPTFTLSLIMLSVSFFLTLQQPEMRTTLIIYHVVLLIIMLYGISNMVEQEPRFSIVYRHEGYTEFIQRTGTVNPDLDAYFNWPVFFIFSAFLNDATGYQNILPYAAWAPVYLNLFYLPPLYMLYTTATANKRIIWLAIWFFFLTNWIAQDYYSPQGYNFFLYVLIIAILLKWFKVQSPTSPPRVARLMERLGQRFRLVRWFYKWAVAPDYRVTYATKRQRVLLWISVLLIFGFVVSSHPLTPFSVLVTTCAMMFFYRFAPRWPGFILVAMTAAWMFFMTQTYLAGHLAELLSEVGNISSTISDNVTNRVQAGDPLHTFITEFRLVMTVFIWVLAFIGAFWRLRRGYQDFTFVLLALAPFPLLLTQSYGGELLLRVYLFSLPAMTFFAAALFFNKIETSKISWLNKLIHSRIPWMKVGIVTISLVLLGGFFFTRYGNERDDYMTTNEVNGVRHLYAIAPSGSLLIAGWDGTPWQISKWEQYNTLMISQDVTDSSNVVVDKDVMAILETIKENQPATQTYLIFTRSQKATAQANGLPPDALDKFELALIASGEFKQIYSNSDAQILQFTNKLQIINPGNTESYKNYNGHRYVS